MHKFSKDNTVTISQNKILDIPSLGLECFFSHFMPV